MLTHFPRSFVRIMRRLTALASTLLACTLLLSACDYDNYDAPQSRLEGVVMYQGEPVGVRQNAINLELWEEGYELRDNIPVNVHQDGTFAAQLFDGQYQLVRKSGPWVTNTDSIRIEVNGNNVQVNSGNAQVSDDGTLQVPVTPYFVIRNADFSLNGSTVTANFDVEQVVDERTLQEVVLLVNSTRLVGDTGSGNIARAARPAGELDGMSGIELSVDLTDEQMANQSSVFARVAVRTQGVPDMYYSQVQELGL